MIQKIELSDFLYEMTVNGICVFENVVPPDLCLRMRSEATAYYGKLRPIQIASGLGEETEWGAHHICGRNDSFHDYLEAAYLDEYVTAYFAGSQYILNVIGVPINAGIDVRGKYEHGSRWHRDVRTYVGQGNRQLLLMLLMIDDFTVDNGATEVLFGSHHSPDFPSVQYIEKNKKTICGPAGSILLMDGDVWHRAGQNLTKNHRYALSCAFTRSFYKQQMDYPRFLEKDYADHLSPRLRQLFGFNARIPSTLEEYYQEPKNRMYKPGQG